MTTKYDKYTLRAHIIPAVVTLLPVFVMWYRLMQKPAARR